MREAISATVRQTRNVSWRTSDFDRLISRWNALSPYERRQRAAECSRNGHQWANVVFQDEVIYVVCRNCCSYDHDH
jgi:hypothetical protein